MPDQLPIPPFIQQYKLPDGKIVQVEINLESIVKLMGPRAWDSKGGISRDGFVVVKRCEHVVPSADREATGGE